LWCKKTSLKSSELFRAPTNCRLELKLTLLDNNMRYASKPQLVFIIMCFRTYCKIVNLLLLCVAVYYDVENVKDPVNIVMNLTNSNLFRMWEIKVGLLAQTFQYKVSHLSCPLAARQLSWNVPAHAGLLHEKAFLFRDTMKATFFIYLTVNYNWYVQSNYAGNAGKTPCSRRCYLHKLDSSTRAWQ